MLLTGDLGFSVLEDFRDTFPRQFLNAGVAEQNMMGIATGLALSGHTVFVYSIIPFVTFRCLEQIRNDICHHQANVKIVGVGSGYSYGHMGATHHALEDIAVMRSLPRMTVVCPADPVEASLATDAVAEHAGPCYLRLGKAGEKHLHSSPPAFSLGNALVLREGKDLTILATGTMVETALHVADSLAGQGIQAQVASMHTIKPLDASFLRALPGKTSLLVTLEEHSVIGGLGSAVAECLALEHIHFHHLLLGVQDAFAGHAGSSSYLRKQAGLDPAHVLERIEHAFHARR